MLPLAHPLSPRVGKIQQFTPQIAVLHVPNIDQALDQPSNVRSSIGGRLNAITTQLSVSSSQQIQLQTSISSLQSLDYASAITKLDEQTTTLQASMQAYTITEGLSLFKYLPSS